MLSVKHKAVCCDLCNKWANIACNNLDKKTNKKLQCSAANRICLTCIKNEMPFTSETDHKLEWIYSGKHIVPFKTKNTETFTKQINTRSNDSSEENLIKSFYYDITKLNITFDNI